MAEILLGIRECFDNAGIGFYAIGCTLKYPIDNTGFIEAGRIEIIEILYSDIYEDAPAERVVEASDAATEFYEI